MWPKGLRRGALFGLAAMMASGGIASAQTLGRPPSTEASPAPSPSPSPSPAVVPTVVAPAASPGQTPAAPAAAAAPTGSGCEAQACVTAREFERSADGHTQFRGFVDLVFGDTRIQADRLDLYETTKVDGTTARRLVADGNVVFMKGDERLSGERMDMQLDTSKGTFDDASGYVSPGVLVEAKRIERVDAGTYKIHGGHFTSCFQPNPRWSFSASSATLHVDDKVKATNVVFRVKDVPAFYFPYFVYPIQEDQRSSGILFPRFGTSGQKGRFIGSDFFWAMGRSTDQTFTVDYYSDYGWGFGHEFRYVRPQPSRGTFRTYLVRRQQEGATAWERDFNWNAVQMLPGKVRASIQVQESSAVSFQQIFQDSLDLASRRTTFRLLTLQRSFARQNAQLLMDSADTYFFDGVNPDPRFDRRRHVPSFTLSQSPRKIARTGIVFGYEGRAEALQIGNQDLLERYLRFDLNPRLSRPLSRSFLTVTPQVQARVTRYGSRRDLATGVLVEDPLDRRFLEAGLEMRGPSFAKVFNTPGNFYSDRFKHTITPEVTYTYRSKFEGFDEIPRFDYLDFLPGTNEVRYGLFQQFLAKRPGASGKPEAYEFLSLRVSQTYYVDIADAQNQFDPNYSSAFFDASGNPAHYSPLQGRLRIRPTPRVSTNLDVEYDVNVRELRNLSFSTNVNYTRLGLDARYSRGRFRFLERVTERDTVRGSARFQLVPNRLTLAGSADYDIIRKNLVQNTARLRYDVQCCGFMIETIESDFNLKKGREWRFNVELANIGSMGSFLGQDPRR